MTKVVAVTGASGYVGTKLLQELERNVNLARVVAIDSKPLPMPVHNIVSKRMDITEQSLNDVFRDLNVDTVDHLAFSIRPGRNRREIEFTRKSNLDSVQNVLRGCSAAKVNNLIFLSSHTVYGPHKDNSVPITEEAQPRPLVEFQYSYDKWLCEREVIQFASENPRVSVTILRSCVVLGPSADNQVARGFFKPFLLGFMGNDPPWQFVHEEDMARLLGLLVMEPQQGIYNVAGNGVVTYSKIASIAGRRLVRLPSVLAYLATRLAWNMGIQKEAPARGLDFVRYPVVMSTGKLKKDTGFKFSYSSEEVLTSYIDSNLV